MRSWSRTKSGAHWRNDDASQSLLDFIINNRRSLTEHEVRPLARQLARTLSLIHAHGVVHRNLGVQNIYLRTDPATAPGGGRQAVLTDFTFAAAVTVSASGSAAPSESESEFRPLRLVARVSTQYSPAPELLLQVPLPLPLPGATEPRVQQVPYTGPPVDVWGLGVVLYTLICRRVPYDGPTLDALRKASLRSPEGLRFPKRVSTDCRDLLRRMLQADPIARASLDEVLDHSWIKPAFQRPCSVSLMGADVPRHAALKWPDQVDHKMFYRIAALESRNGDDAWNDLADALGLASRLCEACHSDDSQAHPLRLTSHVSRPSRAGQLLDRVWSLLAKIRSREVLKWPTRVPPFEKAPNKTDDNSEP